MKFNFPGIITFIKKNPEKLISWFLFTIFIFLSSYLIISWPKRRVLSPAEISVREESGVGLRTTVSVDFGDSLVRKPITYYNDFVQRNPFAGLPGVVGPVNPNGGNDGGYPPPPPPPEELVCRGIVDTPEGRVAFIEGRDTYVVREGDKIEGWKIIKIDEENVKLYNKRKRKEIILPLGGGRL